MTQTWRDELSSQRPLGFAEGRPISATELHCPPLYGTPRTPGRPTLGPNLAKIAADLGKPLMPHQRLIADVALEIDPETGLLAYGEVDVIINRQQGKSELMFPAMIHRCTGFDKALAQWVRRELGKDVPDPGPQRVFYTAQRAEDARQKWRDIHVQRLEASPFRSQLEIRKRLAAEMIRWPNGSTWSPGAATSRAGGTGDTIDMGIIDEAWSRPDNGTELAMRPAMLTRDWAQLWVLSMIPGLSRAAPGTWPYLRQKRQNGRARVQAGSRRGVAYFEWGMADGMDAADPATWWSSMPGLAAGLVSEAKVRQDFEGMDLVDFKAEYLSVEPTASAAKWSVISESTWRSLAVPAVTSRYVEPVAFGIEAQPDLSMASIGLAALDVDGDVYVEPIERQPGLMWTIPAVVDLAKRFGPCAIGVAAHGPAAPIITPLERALLEADADVPVIKMQGPQVGQACRQFFLETGEVGEVDGERTDRRIRHPNDRELNDSIAGLTKYVWSDEWRFARSSEAGDASPTYAVVLARAAGEEVEWLGGSYDVASSLG